MLYYVNYKKKGYFIYFKNFVNNIFLLIISYKYIF